jgi:hypothetical protein
MPKKTLVTEAHLAYLRKAVEEEVSYAAMARHIGVCTDTCKRILHKHDIVQFSGAKFIAAKPLEVVTWTRPLLFLRRHLPPPQVALLLPRLQKTKRHDLRGVIR